MVDKAFYRNNGPFSLAEVARICEARITDNDKSGLEVQNIATMEGAQKGDVCFFYDKKAKEAAGKLKATACITTEDLAQFVAPETAVLVCANPKLAFLKLNAFFYEIPLPEAQIAASAKIDKSVQLGMNCFIGENVVIGKNVKIGNNCILEANVVIEDNCEIGQGTRIGVGVHAAFCKIGENCRIFSGARIGQDGFGFMMIGGQHKRIPQLGLVIIGNDVEVGANACIDRGALDDTVIGDGCRIDNLVQIAHNVRLGRGCILVSQVGIAGSTVLGDYVVCGGQVGLADHVHVGSGAQIAAQSGVMSDVEAGAVVMGYPVVPIKQFMRQTAFVQNAVKPKK